MLPALTAFVCEFGEADGCLCICPAGFGDAPHFQRKEDSRLPFTSAFLPLLRQSAADDGGGSKHQQKETVLPAAAIWASVISIRTTPGGLTESPQPALNHQPHSSSQRGVFSRDNPPQRCALTGKYNQINFPSEIKGSSATLA